MICKEIFCDKCCERQVHKKIGKGNQFEGLGIARGIFAVFTLGLSEALGIETYWKCLKCGEIQKKGV